MSKFLPNEENRRLLPGFICFCTAAFGAAMGFLAFYLNIKLLGIAAFILTAIGIFGGVVAIVYGWWKIFRKGLSDR